MSRVGVIGDTHLPYELDGYLEFCQEQFKMWDCDTIIHVGDLIDNHSLSFHDSEPMLQGAHGELLDARTRLKAWFKAFPNLRICGGNHDLIPARQLKKIGMEADVWMRPLAEVYGFPDGWEVVDTVTIDGVLYHHGYTAMGANGFRNDAIKRMCRTVSGHAHGNAGISATASDHRLVWGMGVGCGIDVDSMAFAYGKHFLQKPIISCGIVIEGSPYIEYMQLGEKN